MRPISEASWKSWSESLPDNSFLGPENQKRAKRRTIRGAAPKAPRGQRTFPPKDYLKKQAERLTKFSTLKLEDPTDEKLGPKSRIAASVVEEIRRRSEAQLEQLIQELGVDGQHPEKWRRAFYHLAAVHQGVGVISWIQPRGSNRRAAKWKDDHDINLHLFMLKEMKSGLPPSQALRKIASDPEKWAKLAPRKENSRSEKSDSELRYQSIRKRWSLVQKTSLLEKVLQRAIGISADQQLLVAPPDLGKSKLQSAPH